MVIFFFFVYLQFSLNNIEVAHGELSQPNEFPHMVSIISSSRHYCGGGLINNKTVLLAAHCLSDNGRVHEPSALSVQIGTVDVSDPSKGRIVPCESGDIHPNWEPSPVDGKFINDYDVALLHLKEYVQEDGEGIRYMDLDLEGLGVVGNDAVISGWGYYSTHYNRDYQLRDAVIPIQESELCTDRGLDVTPSLMICAGDGHGKDSCSGDSGSPLVRLKNPSEISTAKRWTVIGIVSFGTSTCGSDQAIGVYSRVSAYKDFLLEHTFLPDPPSESIPALPYLDTLDMVFVNGSLENDDDDDNNDNGDDDDDDDYDDDHHIEKGEETWFDMNILWLIPVLVFVCMVGWIVYDVTFYLCIPGVCACTFIGCLFCGVCALFDWFMRYRQGFRRIRDEIEDDVDDDTGFHDMEYDLNEDPQINSGDISGVVGGDVTINN